MEVSVRLGFIWKVFAILCISLIFTTLFVCLPLYIGSIATWFQENMWLFITACILAFMVEIAIFCCSAPSRKVPINYICLFTFVLCESIMVAYCCSSVAEQNGKTVVFIAAGMTACIVAVLTAYAFITKSDFTTCMGALWVIISIFFIFGIFALIFRHDSTIQIIYCSMGVMIFGLYLVIDV